MNTPVTSPTDRRDLALMVLIGLGAVALQLPIHDRWAALLDEGYILAIADDVNHGRVLYRDVIVDAPLPGAFHLLAWWFRVAGTSILASRWLAMAGFAIWAMAAWAIARTVLPRPWALAFAALLAVYRIAAFPHWHIYSYSLVAATLVTCAVATTGRAWRRGRPGLFVLAGALAGAGVLCKQDYGLAITATLGLALLLAPLTEPDRPRSARTWLGPPLLLGLGALALIVPTLGWYAAQGALPALVRQTLLVPLSGAARFDYTRLPALWPFFAQDPELRAQIGSYLPSILATLWWDRINPSPLWREGWLWDAGLKLLYWAPLVIFPLAGGLLARTRRRRLAPAGSLADVATSADGFAGFTGLLLLAWSGGFLLAFNRPRDWVHLMMIYPPALLLGLVLLRASLAALPRVPRRLATTAAAGVLLVLLVTAGTLARDLRRANSYRLQSPRAGVFVDARNGPIIEDVLADIAQEQPPAEALAVWPVQPMLTFLAGRRPVAGFHVLWPVQESDRDTRIVAELEDSRAPRVIYSLSQFQHLGPVSRNAPELWRYLNSDYEIDAVFDREPHGPLITALARRTETHAAGEPTLPAGAVQGSAAWRLWPFGTVLATAIGGTTNLVLDVPPEGGALALEWGVNPERWLSAHAGPFTFRVAVQDRARGVSLPLLETSSDPSRDLNDRRWTPARIDLARWAGSRVELVLRIDAAAPVDDPLGMAGWREPRLVPAAR